MMETIKNKSLFILFLCLLVSVGQLAVVIYLPSMPSITKEFHTSAPATESTLTMYMLFFGLSQLIYGPISDLLGRKKIVLFSLLLYIISSIGSALSTSITMFLMARCMEGLGAGGVFALSRAIANDVFSGKELTHALAYTSIAASLSVMLSPTVGGLIQQYSRWQVNFWFLAAYTMILLVIAFFYCPNISILSKKEKSYFHYFYFKYKEILTDRRFLVFALCGSIAFSISTAYYTASPFIFQHQLHLTPSEYGSLFLFTSGSYIVGGLFFNHVPFNESYRFWFGIILMILSACSMFIFSYLSFFNLYTVLVPMMFIMFSMSLIFIASVSGAVKNFKHSAGTASAMVGCLQICAASAMSGVAAHLPQTTAMPLALLLLAISLGVLVVGFFKV